MRTLYPVGNAMVELDNKQLPASFASLTTAITARMREPRR